MTRWVVALLCLALLAAPLAVEAQQPGKTVRIGVLSQGFPDPPPGLPLVRPLQALGWVEGQNLVFESRFAEGKPDRLPTLAAELVAQNVDVIFTRGTPAALAARATTATIPIVMTFVANPVRSRLVASLAHPGGNVTGTANLAADIFGKQLQLLKEIVPRASAVGVLFDPLNSAQMDQLHNELAAAAAVLAVKLHPLKVDASSALEAVFAEALHKRSDALVVFPLSTGTDNGRAVADLAIKHGCPQSRRSAPTPNRACSRPSAGARMSNTSGRRCTSTRSFEVPDRPTCPWSSRPSSTSLSTSRPPRRLA
jgi:putative ABC transport system substrate-binding protein